MNRNFSIILHNIRSAYNVGSMFRTADGAGVTRIYLTGYTPAPAIITGSNLSGKPPVLTRAQKMLAKTALGAEKNILWQREKNIGNLIKKLKVAGVHIVALEQSSSSVDYRQCRLTDTAALIVGNEVRGLDARTLSKCDIVIEIPMRGKKRSLNVAVALGIAIYDIGQYES